MEKSVFDGYTSQNSKINQMHVDLNFRTRDKVNLVNDVWDDDQEGVSKVEKQPFLHWLDSVSA